MVTLTPVDDALGQMLESVNTLPVVEQCPLIDALGRVLAEDVEAAIAVPLDDNSAMDGYALRAADADKPLPVSQRIPAGHIGTFLEPGTAARIFTGAAIPPGADAVVMQENCSESEGVVTVSGGVAPNQNIRPCGQDIAVGEVVLKQGRRLRAQDLGLLASIGCDRVRVYRPLRVAVLSTGDELIEPGSKDLQPGQLYNSNRYTLAGFIRGLGMQFIDGGIIADEAELTANALQKAAQTADCVITSGGVSVGEEDHVKQQVQRLGQLDLWKLAIKPGKPLAFGSIENTPFIGLPGNPSSVFVTFCIVAKPFLQRLQGVREKPLPPLSATAAFSIDRAGSRQDYLRVSLQQGPNGLEAHRFPNQSSGVLSSVSHSDALAIIPIDTTVAMGDSLQLLPLDLLSGFA